MPTKAVTVSNFVSDILDSYIESLLWSTLNDRAFDEDGNPVDGEPEFMDGTDRELAPSFENDALTDVETFLADAAPYLANVDASAVQIGHDIALTRNRHGAGFWDRPEMYGGKRNADRLTDIAHKLGEVDPYTGDDDLIYHR